MARRPVVNLMLNLGLLSAALVVGFAGIEGLVRAFSLMGAQRAAALGAVEEAAAKPDSGTDETASPAAAASDDTTGDEQAFSRWIIHPYRGITTRPLRKSPDAGPHLDVNALGILGRAGDPRQLSRDEIIVGIFGGSVARDTAIKGGAVIERILQAAVPPEGPRVRVVNFAISGYKQPQQLFLLHELILLGTPIDVVINLDGFNEIALGTTDADRGHHPLYPQYNFWISALASASGALSEEQILKSSQIIDHRRRAEQMRAFIRDSPWLRKSHLVQILLGSRILAHQAAAVAAETQLRELPSTKKDEDLFTVDDPCLGTKDACRELVVDLWIRSSHLMKNAAESLGAQYFHVLQPNQYVAGSKTLTDDELATAWRPEWSWSAAAAAGYGDLRAGGARLEVLGIDFYDMTQVFAEVPETLYVDICCHLNPRGYQILSTAIAEQIVPRIDFAKAAAE